MPNSVQAAPAAGAIRFSAPTDLPGVATVIHLEGNTSTSCYLNSHYTLKRIKQSASTLHFRGRSSVAPRGSSLVCLLDPGEMLRTSQIQVPEIIEGVMITPEFVTQIADELDLGHASLWFKQAFMNHPALAHALGEFFSALSMPNTVLERQSRLAGIMQIVLASCMEKRARPIKSGRVPIAIRNVKALLHEYYTTEITMDELIAVSGLSRCRLIQAFTQAVGVPPHRYQIHLRIAHARELLRQGFSQASVASSSGFYDQSHFGKQFRRIVGVTPGVFVKSTQGM